MNWIQSAARRLSWRVGLGAMAATGLLFVPVTTFADSQQASAEDLALLKLNAGRRAFNEKNYPFAINSFKEFLAGNGGHREAPAAWYGLGLCLIQGPNPDYTAAVDAFGHANANADFAERPMLLYYWGTALRGLGNRSSADALARPNEAEALCKTANGRYEEAAKHFVEAQAAFAQRVTEEPAAGTADLPADLQWSARVAMRSRGNAAATWKI